MADTTHAPCFIPCGRQLLVAGLRWTLTEGRSASAARRVARENDADWFAAVIISKQQLLAGTVNLAEHDLTQKEGRKSASLALSVLPALGPDGWAVFRLPDDRFWFVAAKDAQLSVFSDVVGSEEAVRQALQTFMDFDTSDGASRTVICPDGFQPDITGAEQPLDSLLSALAVPRIARLQPVSNSRALIGWSALLIVVFGGYFGWQQYQSWQDSVRAEAARAAYLEARERMKSATPSTLLPWKSQPVLTEFVASCSRQWKQAPLSIAGWRFTTAECTQQRVRFAWSKPAGGTIGDFARRLAHWYPSQPPLFNIPGAADTGGVSVALDMPVPENAEAVPGADAQTQRLTNYAQQLRARLSLTPEGGQVKVINGKALPLPWQTFSFQFDTDIPPDRLFQPQHFDATGIRLTRISVSLNNARLHYSLEGKLYAQPKDK